MSYTLHSDATRANPSLETTSTRGRRSKRSDDDASEAHARANALADSPSSFHETTVDDDEPFEIVSTSLPSLPVVITRPSRRRRRRLILVEEFRFTNVVVVASPPRVRRRSPARTRVVSIVVTRIVVECVGRIPDDGWEYRREHVRLRSTV
jgi:hypothetical protein